jgi:hypothetical protein
VRQDDEAVTSVEYSPEYLGAKRGVGAHVVAFCLVLFACNELLHRRFGRPDATS